VRLLVSLKSKKKFVCLCKFINHSQPEKRPSLWHAWLDLPCKWIVYYGEWHGSACTLNLHLNKSQLKPKRINHLTPNGHYMGRTAQLTSRLCILYIYSTNIRTEYFKHAAFSPFFPLQNAVYFKMLPFLVHVLFTF